MLGEYLGVSFEGINQVQFFLRHTELFDKWSFIKCYTENRSKENKENRLGLTENDFHTKFFSKYKPKTFFAFLKPIVCTLLYNFLMFGSISCCSSCKACKEIPSIEFFCNLTTKTKLEILFKSSIQSFRKTFYLNFTCFRYLL